MIRLKAGSDIRRAVQGEPSQGASRIPPMIRPLRALGRRRLLVAGLSVSPVPAPSERRLRHHRAVGDAPRSSRRPRCRDAAGRDHRGGRDDGGGRHDRSGRDDRGAGDHRSRRHVAPAVRARADRVDGRSSSRASSRESLEVPIDYANPDAGHVRAVPRPPPRQRPGRAHRLAARQPGRTRVRRAVLARQRRPRLSARTCSTASTSSAGTRAAPA